jgi:hypothetical protein
MARVPEIYSVQIVLHTNVQILRYAVRKALPSVRFTQRITRSRELRCTSYHPPGGELNGHRHSLGIGDGPPATDLPRAAGVLVYKEPASAKQREKQRVYRLASEATLNDDSDQAHTLVRVPCDMATPTSTWGADITTAPGLASVRSQKMEGALHARQPPAGACAPSVQGRQSRAQHVFHGPRWLRTPCGLDQGPMPPTGVENKNRPFFRRKMTPNDTYMTPT